LALPSPFRRISPGHSVGLKPTCMQTLPALLQLTLPPQKQRTYGVAIATTAYAVLLLAFKFFWPSAHERSETLLHLLGEAAFQIILFAIFFTFLRFIWPRKIRPRIEMTTRPVPNSFVQLREDPAAEPESDTSELTGASAARRQR